MFVKYVASNVKGGVSCNLGPKTLIVGPNGSGKSAVINTLELALAGFAGDIAGREEVKKETELMALAPESKGELFARALLSTGQEARWAIGGKDGKKASHQTPDIIDRDKVLPLRPVREAIRGSANTARKFFLTYALPALTKDDVLAQIPAVLHDNYRDAVLSAPLEANPVDKLLLALEFSEKKKRNSKSKVKDQEEIVTAVAEGLAPLPPESVITTIKNRKAELKKLLESLDQRRGAATLSAKQLSDVEPVKHAILQAEENLAKLDASIKQLDEYLNSLGAPAIMTEDKIWIVNLIRMMAKFELETGQPVACPLCKTSHPPGTFPNRLQAIEAYLAAEAQKQGPAQFTRDQKNELLKSKAQWQSHLASLHTQFSSLQSVIAQGAITAPTEAEYAAVHDELAKVDAEETKIATLKAQWSQTNKARDAAVDSTKEANNWELLFDACSKAVAKLLDAGVIRFTTSVQEFLPPADKFHLSLRDGKRQTFRLGLERNGNVHTALSGAEWVRVMVAVTSACVEPGKLSVVIPEDRAFDPKTLESVMHALGSVQAQVVLASPVLPAFIPSGWTIIDVTKGEHRSGRAE